MFFFEKFIDDTLINDMTVQTNLYCTQAIANQELPEHCRKKHALHLKDILVLCYMLYI